MIDFKKYIREGNDRCDLSLLYLDPIALDKAIEKMTNPFLSEHINKVAALDALGFVFGSRIAEKLHVGLVLIRKEGKIPVERISVNFIDYSNESKSFEVAKDVIVPGENILIIDDWAETGSQIKATISLVEKCGGIISGISCFNIDKKVKSDKELSKYKMSSVI
jgi:adenine phosphoribosyltransferase